MRVAPKQNRIFAVQRHALIMPHCMKRTAYCRDLVPDASHLRAQGSHQAIIDAVDIWAKGAARTGRMEAQILARKLRRLRDIRKIADYALTADFDKGESRYALNDAVTIFNETAHAKRKMDRERDV